MFLKLKPSQLAKGLFYCEIQDEVKDMDYAVKHFERIMLAALFK